MKLAKKHKGFTLVEMLIVLLVISVLILLFIPNLAGQKDTVNREGNKAIVKIVETQMELYKLDTNTSANPSVDELASSGYLTAEQAEKYKGIPQK